MAYARLVNMKFKPGTRDEAIKIIDDAPKQQVKGFKGILTLLPMDDSDSATIISVWDSEDSLMASQEGIFQDVMKATEHLREGPMVTKNVKLREMRGQLMLIPA